LRLIFSAIPEVTLFFQQQLFRVEHRSRKVDANGFNAFDSPNFRSIEGWVCMRRRQPLDGLKPDLQLTGKSNAITANWRGALYPASVPKCLA